MHHSLLPQNFLQQNSLFYHILHQRGCVRTRVIVEAIPRLLHPHPLEQVGLGLAFSVAGAVINGVLAWFMLRAGKRLRSITLEADAHHLFADVFTTAGA